LNPRRSRNSLSLACSVACFVGLGATASGQTPDCKTVPREQEKPEEVVAKEWLSSKSPFASVIAVTHSEPGKVTETVAEGRVEVATDGTLHYHVARTIRKHAPGESASTPGRLITPDVEFWVRGAVVVLVDPKRGIARLKLDDVAPKTDEKSEPSKSSAPTADLLAALGGDDELSVERAGLMRWTAGLGDPRRCMTADDVEDFTSFNNSSSPNVHTFFAVPNARTSGILRAVFISDASLDLEWAPKDGVRSATLKLRTNEGRANPKLPDHFYVVVAYAKLSDAALAPPPVEVQSKLTSEPATK